MAITLRSTSTGPNNSATSTTINLAAGTTTGDVSFLIAAQGTAGGVLTAPAGWTTLASPKLFLVAYRVWQGGDPASVTVTSTATAFFESAIIAYTGADTTTPVDASNSCVYVLNPDNTGKYRAPPVQPNWNGSQLLVGYAQADSGGGGSLVIDGSLTSRVSSASGPNVAWCDKVLTDGTNTGPLDATWVSKKTGNFGIQVAIKASGAAAATLAAPTLSVVAEFIGIGINSSVNLPLDAAGVQDGDLVVVQYSAGDTITPPAGYTTQKSQDHSGLYTHPWSTGDSTAPTFTFGSLTVDVYFFVLIRKVGASAQNGVLDGSSKNTGTGSSNVETLATTAMTPSDSKDMLLCFWATPTDTSAGTSWTSPPGSFSTGDLSTVAGPSIFFGWVNPAAAPTGTFSVTLNKTGSPFVVAYALLVHPGPIQSFLPFTPFKNYLRR